MKRTLLIIGAASVLFTACNNEATTETNVGDTTNKTASSTTEEKWTPLTREEMDKAWMANMTQGEMHKLIASTNGTWDCEVSMKMAADSAAMVSKGTQINRSIFNGLYQESAFKGDFAGMPFEGKSTTAYDNAKKKFISTWIDNMGSGMMMMEGDYDAATKTINLAGNCTNPVNGKTMGIRESMKIVDENNMVMEMYAPDPNTGKEYQNMVITMKRKK